MLHVNSRGTTFENSLNINARPPPVLHVIARNWQILEFIISWPFALVTVFMSIPSLRLTCNQAVIPFLSFQRRVEKEKFADGVFAFPEVKKKKMNGCQSVPGVLMVGTAGRRLLSDLHGFYFSFEVISFYSSFFHISQSLRDIFQTISTSFQQSQLGEV